MSTINGTAPKESVASEPLNDPAAELLRKYSELMREAGSPNGAWNPEPDEWISGVLRDDVALSPNETKAIFGVKAHCIRNNPGKGRTAWGWTATEKPFRATELGNLFGWDPSNTMKHLARPLAYGFIRRDEKTGQLGLGALVRGKYVEPKPEPGTPSEVDLLVCTYQLPRYLAEAVCSQLNENRKVAFLLGWQAIKERKQQELNTEKQRIYESEQNDLSEHCKAFDPRLPELKRKQAKPEPAEAERPDDDWSVHTSSVQNGEAGPYNASESSVRTTYIRKQSKAKSVYEQSSSSVAEAESITATTTNPNPSGESADRSAEIGVVTAALALYCRPEQDKVIELIATCRQNAPDCTKEEIVQVIHEKGKLIRDAKYPLAFAVKAVSNCFKGEAYRHVRARCEATAQRVTAATEAERWPDTEPWPPKTPLPELIEQRRAELRERRKTDPDHPRVAYLKREIPELEAKLATAEADPVRNGAGGGQ